MSHPSDHFLVADRITVSAGARFRLGSGLPAFDDGPLPAWFRHSRARRHTAGYLPRTCSALGARRSSSLSSCRQALLQRRRRDRFPPHDRGSAVDCARRVSGVRLVQPHTADPGRGHVHAERDPCRRNQLCHYPFDREQGLARGNRQNRGYRACSTWRAVQRPLPRTVPTIL